MNSVENEENNDSLLNSDVVADTENIDHLEAMPLDEFDATLKLPESIQNASLLTRDGIEAFRRRKSSSWRKLTEQESRAEREMGGFEWLDSFHWISWIFLGFLPQTARFPLYA